MRCSRCGHRFEGRPDRCPRCGKAIATAGSGVFQTSTVLISAGGTEGVYRSVKEMPARLRSRLIKSTNSTNSATILIADRRGRKEIERAMRAMPAPMQRRLMQALLGTADDGSSKLRLTGRGRVTVLALMILLIGALLWLVYVRPGGL